MLRIKGKNEPRRKYATGTCQDCGRTMRTTVVTFWVNGHQMRLCSECINAYRDIILRPSKDQNALV